MTEEAACKLYKIGGMSALAILLVMSIQIISKGSAYWGMLSGVLMAVPATAGTIGPIFALASLVPRTLFSVLVAYRLFRLGSMESAASRQLFPETA